MPDIGRVLTAMVTPFDSLGKVDYGQAKRLARALIESGSDGVVVAGTTGESPTLTRQEQAKLFVEIREAVGTTVTVLAGTGSNNTNEALEYTLDAQEAGVDGVLLVVPYYNKPTQEGLYQHFKTIAGGTSLPCVLYNVPSRTVTNMGSETTIRLSHIPNIIGIKEANSDFEHISRIISGAEDGFKVWSGNDADTFGILCMGGYGVISVASHLVGSKVKLIISKVLEGKIEEAAHEHNRMMRLFTGIFIVANPIPIKYCLNRIGFKAGSPRLPLVEPDEATREFLDTLLDEYAKDVDLQTD